MISFVHIDSETGKAFRKVPKLYKSNFNKLTLLRDEYTIYCEPIECLDLSKLKDCDNMLLIEYLKQEVRLKFDKLQRGDVNE